MPEFSDVLRQRLASREVAEDHPDADTLTAFSESVLPRAERDQILDHLALCRECREVVSLSLTQRDTAAAESPAVVAPRNAARRAWTRWFGLVGSLAAMAVVATVIVKLPQQRRSAPVPQEQAKVEPLTKAQSQPGTAAVSNPTAAFSAPLPAKPIRGSETATNTRQLPNHAKSVVAGRAETTTPPAPVVETPRATASTVSAIAEAAPRRDYVNDKIFAQNDAGRTSLADAELPKATALDQNAGERKSAQLSMFPDLAQPTMNAVPPKSVAAAPAPAAGRAGFTRFAAKVAKETKDIVRKRSLAVQPGVMSFSSMAGQLNPATEKAGTVEAESTTPAATPGGELDQSGAFTHRALTSSAAATVNTGFQPSWTVEDSKLLRTTESGAWITAYTGSPSIDFSVVTSHGADVWAGGNRATLIHSRDSGVNWERVRLGSNASGSISSIAVTGTTVQITTSEGQTWSSDDGGKTWAQQ